MFGAEDRMQVESNYNLANQHYNTMVSSAEQGLHSFFLKHQFLLSPQHFLKHFHVCVLFTYFF